MNAWEWADRHPMTVGFAIFFTFLIVSSIVEAFQRRELRR